jgi:hypothetical protein
MYHSGLLQQEQAVCCTGSIGNTLMFWFQVIFVNSENYHRIDGIFCGNGEQDFLCTIFEVIAIATLRTFLEVKTPVDSITTSGVWLHGIFAGFFSAVTLTLTPLTMIFSASQVTPGNLPGLSHISEDEPASGYQ